MSVNELAYINRISSRLNLFKRGPSGSFQFRCPYCGDSAKNKYKTRGNLYLYQSSYLFNCYNCGYSTSLYKFLEYLDPLLAKEFALEEFAGKGGTKTTYQHPSAKTKLVWDDQVLSQVDAQNNVKRARGKFPAVADLHDDHAAAKYLSKRAVPKSRWDKIFYTKNPSRWIEEEYATKPLFENASLIFPMVSESNYVEYGAVLRNLEKGKNRYQSVIKDESYSKGYGFELIDRHELCFVTEGVFDSLVLPNAAAGLDHSVSNAAKRHNMPKDRTVLIFDNEPRNKFVMNAQDKAIRDGWRVLIWPSNIKEKDLSEMAEAGKPLAFVVQNCYSNSEAKLRFTQYRIA